MEIDKEAQELVVLYKVEFGKEPPFRLLRGAITLNEFKIVVSDAIRNQTPIEVKPIDA